MRNSETGEFELVVGNRQLLSGFFIVVLLFAVAFAMGYVVGQNSPRSAKGATDTAAATPPVADPTRPQPAPAPPPAQQEPAAAPPTETQAPPSATPAAADTPAQTEQQPAAQPAAAAKEAAKTASKAPERSSSDVPMMEEMPGPAGSFWQVIALAKPDAEVIAGALKKKGFPAFLTPGTKGLVRVMVGPYADTAAMGKAKTDLASAGFPSPVRK